MVAFVAAWRSWVLGGAMAAATAFASERITYGEVPSAALGRTLPVAVVAPAGKAAAETPVLFLLHGRGRHHRSLIDAPEARAALLTAPFFIVLPQGEDGWYIDSPAKPADRYGAYLTEVVAWADRALPVSKAAARRGIAGWSMGGYGAVRFAQTLPGAFGFVGSVIGLLDFPRPETLPAGQNYKVPLPRFTSDPARWRELNPLQHVAALRGSALTLVLATRGFERTMNEHFLTSLEAHGGVARVHWLEGGHEFTLVERALVPLLADAAEQFFQP
ncbi:alpha/beta hydrolase [Horticoccus sp. 23ND18S-11]